MRRRGGGCALADSGLEFGKEPRTDLGALKEHNRARLDIAPAMPSSRRETLCAGAMSMHWMHTVYLGIGSNLGDRQGNILQALQKLRARASIEALSSYYETQPVAG